MSSISAADADVLYSIGREAMQNIIALAVEAVLWSELYDYLQSMAFADSWNKATYLILVYIASEILLYVALHELTRNSEVLTAVKAEGSLKNNSRYTGHCHHYVPHGHSDIYNRYPQYRQGDLVNAYLKLELVSTG